MSSRQEIAARMAHLDALLKAGGWTLAQYKEWSFEYMDLYKKRKEMKKDVKAELEKANRDLEEDLEKVNTRQAMARETATVVRIREWDSEDENPDAEFEETGTKQARAPGTTAAVWLRQCGSDDENPNTEVEETGATHATARETTAVMQKREWHFEDEKADAEFDETNTTQMKTPETPAEDLQHLCEGPKQAGTAKTGALATPVEEPQDLREGFGEISSSMQTTPLETLEVDPPAQRQQPRSPPPEPCRHENTPGMHEMYNVVDITNMKTV